MPFKSQAQRRKFAELLVQMLDAQRIQAEIVLSLAPVTEFSANARVLIR